MGLQYAGELIAAFIERAGGSVKGKISTGAVPGGVEPAIFFANVTMLARPLRVRRNLSRASAFPGCHGKAAVPRDPLAGQQAHQPGAGDERAAHLRTAWRF